MVQVQNHWSGPAPEWPAGVLQAESFEAYDDQGILWNIEEAYEELMRPPKPL